MEYKFELTRLALFEFLLIMEGNTELEEHTKMVRDLMLHKPQEVFLGPDVCKAFYDECDVILDSVNNEFYGKEGVSLLMKFREGIFNTQVIKIVK